MTPTAKHTKGPFRVEKNGVSTGRYILNGNGVRIAEVYERTGGVGEEGCKANADLLAAAPALLAAAEAALDKLTFVLESNCQCKSGGVQPGTCTLCFIRAAIAMAKREV